MSSADNPQPGDKVRVTGTVGPNGEYPGKVSLENRELYDGTYSADWTLEIVERADDPSRDLVGTVAELHGAVWVKHFSDAWSDVGRLGYRIRRDGAMNGRRVTGAVPGTPAAEAQQPASISTDELFGRKPLVIQYGDPEPDCAHKYRSVAGPIIEMGVFGWRMFEFNGDATINVPWSAIPEKHFPLTEVVVEP